MNSRHWTAVSLSLACLTSLAVADGTEMLGTPSIAIDPGTGIVMDGVGLINGDDTIVANVPAGATVVQALLYWEGFDESATGQGATDNITINVNGGGNMAITGDRIGGPTLFFTSPVNGWSTTYRYELADGLIGPGANTVAVSGLDFSFRNNGAGLAVIYTEPDTISAVELRDGNDCCFVNFAGSLAVTEPQTFNFAPLDFERDFDVDLMVSSVALETPADCRPTVIDIKAFQGAVELAHWEIQDKLDNSDGDEWDTYSTAEDGEVLTLPANVDRIVIELMSKDIPGEGDPDCEGNLPASMVWIAGSLTLEGEEQQEGEGCTPGFWKNHLEEWAMTPFAPGDDFGTTFGVNTFSGMTLEQVVRQGGGCKKALGRHAVAAILNAGHPDLDYAISDPNDIIAMVAAVIDGDDCDAIEELKDQLDEFNTAGCFDDDNDDEESSSGGNGSRGLK